MNDFWTQFFAQMCGTIAGVGIVSFLVLVWLGAQVRSTIAEQIKADQDRENSKRILKEEIRRQRGGGLDN